MGLYVRGQRLKISLNYRTQKTDGTLRALFKTPVGIGDFDGILRARSGRYFGPLRALRRDLACALYISCISR